MPSGLDELLKIPAENPDGRISEPPRPQVAAVAPLSDALHAHAKELGDGGDREALEVCEVPPWVALCLSLFGH